jgi:hypothetical protein
MTVIEIVAAVDAFLAATKIVVGAGSPVSWADGYNPNEKVIYLPLEVEGELTGAKLMVVGFPAAKSLKFRLGILFPGAVCRLDYTDETHSNTVAHPSENLPAIVEGPHYHSWRLNRRFCRGSALPTKLHNAQSFSIAARTFDSILRWFCADTNIEGLPPDHRIELPVRTTLL